MNGELFYEEFKNALRFLGVPWGDMRSVTVYVDGYLLCFEHGGRKITVEMGKPNAPNN